MFYIFFYHIIRAHTNKNLHRVLCIEFILFEMQMLLECLKSFKWLCTARILVVYVWKFLKVSQLKNIYIQNEISEDTISRVNE